MLERMMKGRNVSMRVKKGLKNSNVLPTLSYIIDMECSTAGMIEGCGNEAHKRCMWNIKDETWKVMKGCKRDLV